MRKNTAFGAVAFATAAAIALGGVSGVAFAENAVAPATTQTAGANPSTIDFKAKGSITVNKYELAGKPVPATGSTTATAPKGATPLNGAKFKVVKVQDITDEATFAKAVDKVKNDNGKPVAGEGTQVGAVQETANGTTTFSDLPVGLYAVYETEAPKDYVKIDPYYVFVPTTLTKDDDASKGLKEWNYNIQTFPKDAKDVRVVKSIDDANQNVGDTIVYHIDSDIPALPNPTDAVTFFQFEDFLETENAEITTTDKTDDASNKEEFRKKFSVEIINDKGEALQVLTADSFETPVIKTTTKDALPADEKDGEYHGADNIQHTTVTLNNKGLYWLTWYKQNYTGVKVRLNLPATVKAVGNTDGHEVNDAGVRRSIVKPKTGGYTPPVPPTTPPQTPPTPPTTPPTTPPNPPTPPTPPTPEIPPTPPTEDIPFIPANDVHTYWGKIKVNKKDEAGNPLNGAKFKLYRCVDKAHLVGDPIAIKTKATDPKDVWETGVDGDKGTLVIDGVHVNDYVDSKEQVSAQPQYCLVEVEAPKGFELLTEPVEVKLTRNDHEIKETPNVIAKAQDITNHPTNVFRLPNTGGAGFALLAAAGLGIVAVGGAFARRNTKKA